MSCDSTVSDSSYGRTRERLIGLPVPLLCDLRDLLFKQWRLAHLRSTTHRLEQKDIGTEVHEGRKGKKQLGWCGSCAYSWEEEFGSSIFCSALNCMLGSVSKVDCGWLMAGLVSRDATFRRFVPVILFYSDSWAWIGTKHAHGRRRRRLLQAGCPVNRHFLRHWPRRSENTSRRRDDGRARVGRRRRAMLCLQRLLGRAFPCAGGVSRSRRDGRR